MSDPTICPHIVQGDEGTAYCDLAESSVRSLTAEVERLAGEVERLAADERAARRMVTYVVAACGGRVTVPESIMRDDFAMTVFDDVYGQRVIGVKDTIGDDDPRPAQDLGGSHE